MVKAYQQIWLEGFVRPRMQRHGNTQQKIDEDDALIRLCEATADECPNVATLIIRSSVHATTYSKISMIKVPTAPHVTASYVHGQTHREYISHIIVNNYRGPMSTYWPSVERRQITWGRLGNGPDYPGFEFGVQAPSGAKKSMTWSVGDWPALGS